MKFKKISAFALAALLILNLCSCGRSTDKKKKIAVITKSTDSDFWHEVKKGVNTASTEYNADVTFEGPKNEEDYIAQNDMINNAVASGANAIVISAIDSLKSVAALEAASLAGVKIIAIDSTVESDTVSTFIGIDNNKAGRMAAEAAAEFFSENDELRIGILGCKQSPDNTTQREEGIRSFANERSNAVVIATESVDSNIESATAGAVSLLTEHSEINIIIGVNEWMTLGIGNAVSQLGLSNKVCAVGFDSNTASIAKLETGEIDALVVQNPFAMGYLGVQSAFELVSGNSVQSNIYTKVSVITKNNMFEAGNQKILFHFN